MLGSQQEIVERAAAHLVNQALNRSHLGLSYANVQLSLPLTDATSERPPSIIFVRHRRARRYILRVLADGNLRVTLPRWGAKREAQAFVEANRQWIARQRQAIRTTPPIDRRVETELRSRARRELPSELMALAVAHDIAVRRVWVRNQRSRWGSCSRTGSITLNWRLVQTPPFVREYVMLHELMHMRQMNHSPRFWRLVAACCPRYLEARAWLRKEGKRLWSDSV